MLDFFADGLEVYLRVQLRLSLTETREHPENEEDRLGYVAVTLTVFPLRTAVSVTVVDTPSTVYVPA